MSVPVATIAIPIHFSFNYLKLPSNFYDAHKRELSPILIFEDEVGKSFILNLQMGADFKIVECNEEDLFPFMMVDTEYYAPQLHTKKFDFTGINGYHSFNQYDVELNPNCSSETLIGFPTTSTKGKQNIPRQLLEVVFPDIPKQIIIEDKHSKTYTVRVRRKQKKRRTMVLGKGWKKFQVANELMEGDIIRMSFNPNYPNQLRCAVVKG
ncbi:hypothetical protein PIB30_034000 [Stylosanthes scabra]|uniref:TF-B3 domain-containing protein n=1 Tax=Stylosanthes scabra TaxID=79078 RepID=A0ABU6UCV3_9FABA|nr:hypothetical protein [Stylosanthes scabra]